MIDSYIHKVELEKNKYMQERETKKKHMDRSRFYLIKIKKIKLNYSI